MALAGRIGRVRAWLLAMVLSVVAFAGAGLLGAGDAALFAVICVMSGLALGADLVLLAAMAADLGERQKLSGACFGVWNFCRQIEPGFGRWPGVAFACFAFLCARQWRGLCPRCASLTPRFPLCLKPWPQPFCGAGGTNWRPSHDPNF